MEGCARAAHLAEEIRPSVLASGISNLVSPPVLTTVALIVTARLSAEPWALDLAVSYWLVAVLAPFLVLVFLVRRGVIGDLDIRRRDQRAIPLAVTAFCQALGFGLLTSAAASAELLRLAGALLFLTLVLLLVSRWWKISVHAGAAALVFSHHFLLEGAFLPLLLGLPLLIWSRLRLRHHTLGQTLMGSSVGIMLALLFLILFPGG
jgi:membrane-associated phospholipid phosphatase